MNANTLNFAVLPADWLAHWFRPLIDIALAVVIVELFLREDRNRRRNAREKVEDQKRAEQDLEMEHASRLQAERKSHTLSQRLITVHEDERRRLARELHDDVTQRLARLAIDAAQAERGVSGAPGSNSWGRMREQLVRLSGDVHSLAYRLHPSILDELGLVEALRAECDRFSRHESIPVKIESRDVPREIPEDVELCLFRIGQELLRNVARHARASAVEVSLVGMDGGLQFAVHDNGIGFNPAQAREHPSLGLASMKERVSLVAGEMEYESEPGRGTTIVAWVPFKEPLKS